MNTSENNEIIFERNDLPTDIKFETKEIPAWGPVYLNDEELEYFKRTNCVPYSAHVRGVAAAEARREKSS